ncbi:hypothetical protein [uncultured Megasphaera sp.]|uniref:hypothetical protein n=1 Tax=uncultured Megasphaera sp. TaxID=165188 RepID=UPI002619A782|nr:hypothetical protein [uncultured Megasphaera sp.]
MTALAICFVISSYHAWQSWQGVCSQLAPYAQRVQHQKKRETAKRDAVPDVAASLAARNIQLLSWQQSGRERGRQTLVLSGTFEGLLAWLNDWPRACPHGTCQILQWERGEGSGVVTVEISPDGKDGAALH